MFSGPSWAKDVLQGPLAKKRGRGSRVESARQKKQARRVCKGDVDESGEGDVAGEDGLPAERRKKVARPGGGGAWRAYLHVHGTSLRGGAATDLAANYRQLDQEERAYFEELGKQASSLHRLGQAPFGEAAAARRKAARTARASLPCKPRFGALSARAGEVG